MSQQPSRKRPFGIIAIIVLKLVTALSLIANIIILTRSDFASQFSSSWASNEVAMILTQANMAYIIVLMLGLGILTWHLAIVIGLWLFKRWAWFLLMMQLGLSMALCLWVYFQGGQVYVYMWLNTIMVFYLNQSEVQHAFGHKRKPQQEIV